jgi:glycosyltransferase involved in cell wall biosynthesis
MITAITPTGDRRLAFALCQKWMQNQTVKPDQWIVVDDGKVPMTPFMEMEYMRRQPDTVRRIGWGSLYDNLRLAVPRIRGDKILFIEDDEYYAPQYVETMSRLLDEHELVGLKHSRYYHLMTGGYKIFQSQVHASLAQTAFRASFLPTFNYFLSSPRCAEFLDIRLWTHRHIIQYRTTNILKKICRGSLFLDEPPLYVSLKGMPGRNGYGIGHRPDIYEHHDTEDRAILRSWIPEDYPIYLDILNGKVIEKANELCFSF